jgi:hypothetical protein
MRRKVDFLTGLVVTALLVSLGFATPAPAKEETVTLTISGMT